MKIVRDSAVRQEPAQPQAVSPEENRFSIRPRQIALFFLWMLAFTLLARGTSGALLPEVQLSTPAPNTITQSLTATGTIQWAAGSLFYLPEGLLVEAVFVSEGEAVQEGDKIAALRREDVEQKLRSLQAELAQKQTEYARLTKPVAADSYDLEKAQQALQAAYQAAENSAAAWAEKQANAGSERDALQRELNERQEKAAQYAREIAEKQAQRELLQVGTLPHFYYYTIANVGEGIVARRRTYASLVSYLTPPFMESRTRGQYEELFDLIARYDRTSEVQRQEVALQIKRKVVALGLHHDLQLDSVITIQLQIMM